MENYDNRMEMSGLYQVIDGIIGSFIPNNSKGILTRQSFR